MAVLLVVFWDGSQQTNAAGRGAVTTGREHTCALSDTGGLKCFGVNSFGELGIAGTLSTNVFTPTYVDGLSSGVSFVEAGFYHTCAVTSSGGVKCWGQNVFGQVGGVTGDCLGGSLLCTNTPTDVVGLTSGYISVTAGIEHSCALSDAGGVKCWGKNSHGELGSVTTETCTDFLLQEVPCSTVPVDVTGLSSGVAQITAGGDHTCARMNDGTLKCWGWNSWGQVGGGVFGDDNYVPVDVNDSDAYVDVSAGADHTCGVTTAGAAKCWGRAGSGQIGYGGFGPKIFSPNNVLGLTTTAVQIVAGVAHSCAVTSDGGIKCWGENNFGPLGDGTETDTLSPVDTIGLNANPQVVAAGIHHTCATFSGGGMQCWGSGGHGQLGTAAIPMCGTSNLCSLTPVTLAEAWLLDFDADGDGCLNKIELGTDETLGGLRNPDNPWDFYDVLGPGAALPTDGVIDLPNDILGVILHFSPSGAAPYDVNFDRGPSSGPNAWNMTAPDGVIDLPNDILGVILQFNHRCV
ncbi:MAG: chromosome condensation regulator RCC1 [Chloroflexi bacterium]|nr:chromosome condensation regulator RCC1 [Chloroflexota bacterium]